MSSPPTGKLAFLTRSPSLSPVKGAEAILAGLKFENTFAAVLISSIFTLVLRLSPSTFTKLIIAGISKPFSAILFLIPTNTFCWFSPLVKSPPTEPCLALASPKAFSPSNTVGTPAFIRIPV